MAFNVVSQTNHSIHIRVIERFDSIPIENAKVQLRIEADSVLLEGLTDSIGVYVFDDPKIKNGLQYKLRASAGGFIVGKTPFYLFDETKVEYYLFELYRYCTIGSTKSNFNYEFNETDCHADSVNYLFEILNSEPGISVQLRAYQNTEENKGTAYLRGKQFRKALIKRGIKANRLLYQQKKKQSEEEKFMNVSRLDFSFFDNGED